MLLRFLVTTMVLALPLSVYAEPATAAFAKDVNALMEKTGARNIGKQMGNVVAQQFIAAMKAKNPEVPPRAIEIVNEVTTSFISKFADSPNYNDAIVQLYAKHFSHDEIKQMIDFYSGPLGEKIIRVMPQLTAESIQIGQQQVAPIIPDIQRTLKARFEEEGLIEKK